MEDELVSRISRRSIDILKQNYRASPFLLSCFSYVPCISVPATDFYCLIIINAGGFVYGRLETCYKVEINIEDTMSSHGVSCFQCDGTPPETVLGSATAWKVY